MQNQYSLRSPAVKRLMKEAQELQEATETYYAHPLEDNLFEWHFTIRGPEDTEFDGGIYHGRIILPPEYPMKPPSIILLTPNGRFEIFKKICLSISGHHPESWQPSWSIRTALLAIIGFMPTHGNGAIGSLDYTPEERKILARRSLEFKCSDCGPVSTILKPVTEASKESNREAKELAKQINFQAEKEKKASDKGSQAAAASRGESEMDKQQATPPQEVTTGPGVSPANFPGFPFGFLPSMQQTVRPPATSGTSIPPQFFMPPFWPGNNPQQLQQRFSQQPYNPRMPANPFWPPGFMMPPGMMVPPSPAATTAPLVASATPATSLASGSKSDKPASSASVSSAQSSLSNSGNTSPKSLDSSKTTKSSSEEDQRSDVPSPRVTSSAVSPSSSQPSSTVSTTTTNTTTTTTQEAAIRQRQRVAEGTNVVAPSQRQQPRVQRTNQSAELLVAPRGSRGGSGCLGLLMVMILLALVVLVMRRMYMMNMLNFDFNL